MAITQKKAMTGAIWTIASFGGTTGIRFVSNVVLSRLITPEIFGIAMVLSTFRSGIELLTDVGIAQNVVRSRNADDQSFQNSAWTLQFVRSLILCSILSIAAYPLANLYEIPATAIQLSAVTIIFLGLSSTSIFYLQRNLQFGRANMFELSCDFVTAVLIIFFAYMSPTIWSILISGLFAAVFRVGLSYLLPRARNWFEWNRVHVREIFSFGKWMFLSSLLSFLCMNFDKLYLAKTIPLATVGIYAIARTIADLPAFLAGRLGYSLIFPMVSSQHAATRTEIRSGLLALRTKLLTLAALGVACGIAFSDVAVWIIYDPRYSDAGWILAMLLIGTWGAILSAFSEYTLLGLSKPVYGVVANALKLAGILLLLPIGYQWMGLPGVLIGLAVGEVVRYLPLAIGSVREKTSFLLHDLAMTAIVVAATAGLMWGRSAGGYGTSLDAVLPLLTAGGV
ncbi:oligosaccharide flippase family protein [Labrenzia sp. R4_1]|uniref:oligosaccharide flippase family protein n=1 Tax=Labrenzia sp. R4_1 TaxID=2821106 RepID=UPI001ADAD6B6|nr:oligosaccharide flippase family protein [Labrenzia sp. R4_1]